MSRSMPSLPCRLVLFALAVASATRAQEFRTYDAETFYRTVSVSGSSFSADESRILLTSDASGVFNLFSQPVAGGEAVQLTRSDSDAVRGIGFFPLDDRILYTQDEGGNELDHIYVREPEGSSVDLTPGERLKASFAGWSEDDRTFWITTNERDARFFDLYRYEDRGPKVPLAERYPRKLVFQNDAGYAVGGISRDGRRVALVKTETRANNDIFLWDATKPEEAPVLVTPHEGDVSHGSPTFSPDGRRLLFTSDAAGEFTALMSRDIASGKTERVFEADWDVQGAGFSRNGRYRSIFVNEDARTRVTVTDLETGKPLALPAVPGADVVGIDFSRSGKLAALRIDSDRSPANVHVLELSSGKRVQLTRSLTPDISPEHLTTSTVVRYASFDGLEIPALLYRPHQASKDARVPALVWVHGGPGGQSRIGYRADIQALVNHGYAVLAVNNRGSSGYGKTFFHGDDQRHGEDDLQDCVHGRRYLESLDWVDAKRVGIIGGSYGGYMVAAALAFTPKEFDVGIDIFGVTNWLRTLENIPPWWESMRKALYEEMGDPATDAERLRRISPLFHAEKIVKPLLVVQGANDPRVLKVESDELVAAVKKNDVPVEYVVFADEGHGFRKKANRIAALEAYLSFLDEHLKEAARPD